MVDELYLKFISFYQAISFDDQIRFAHEELIKKEVTIDFYNIIFDEYQDFNNVENEFIKLLSFNMKSTLFAGDDDQVLYASLKGISGHRKGSLIFLNGFINELQRACLD
ncbi:UvrD-helicase domain-containing protein [Candidatus Berkiella aquae]|uniref:DNA helicase II n=1 Tax=Candidatus Berkiella aquae TaxID=295108 RepID=A0A0Q9YPI3_9GAMM|nr:UvrD-helicase domain-containing protein [Candidatus Berkiella aquae]MCS5711953.1 UvrD-helicase domain-containing protein [Candidatus Berkiella aquae]